MMQFFKKSTQVAAFGLISLLLTVLITNHWLTLPGTAQESPLITLASTPENVVRGYYAADEPPVLTVKSGDIVKIDTVSVSGIPNDSTPIDFFKGYGIPEEAVLPDMAAVMVSDPLIPNLGPHMVTGPIYIEGAEPGDMLEVRTLDIEIRTPFGVNRGRPGAGVLPDLLTDTETKVIPLDRDRNVALFAEGIEVPLAPFMGILAVAPPPEAGRVSSVPPALWGGNMDLKELTKNSTVYLPVFNEGALFYTGDGHAAQGDGEVNINAIETSLTPTLQFILHKGEGLNMTAPFAETPTHYIPMGLDPDLDEALKKSVLETITFLGKEKGLSPADAYSLASIGVDYEVAEAVDQTEIIHAMIPKSLFATNRPYWTD